MRLYVPPKHPLIFNGLLGVKCQKFGSYIKKNRSTIVYIAYRNSSLFVGLVVYFGSEKNGTTAYNGKIATPSFHSNNWLHGVEPFLRSRKLRSYSRIFQHFMEPEGSPPRPSDPSTGPYPEPDQSSFLSFDRLSQESYYQARRSSVTFCNKLIFYGKQFLPPCPTPQLENHPFSAVRDCLFNIFAATPSIWSFSPPSANWGYAMTWQETNLASETALHILIKFSIGRYPLKFVDRVQVL
jgi:hypothetical protein